MIKNLFPHATLMNSLFERWNYIKQKLTYS